MSISLRKLRKRRAFERKNSVRRFYKHRQLNLLAPPGMHDYIIVLDHLKPSFNIGKIFRTADAFGAYEIHLIGTDFFDPGPAMGSFKWVPTRFHETFESCYKELISRGYALFTMEPSTGEALPAATIPKLSAFIFGNEKFGISFNKENFSEIKTLNIPQLGKVQSLNVSIAASITMYEYLRQHSESFSSEENQQSPPKVSLAE